jgi:hypothetical protein
MEKFSNIKKSKKVTKVVSKKVNESSILIKEDTDNRSDVSKFFSKLFESREIAHIFHLQLNKEEGSYVSHIALNEYYDEVLEMIDELIEVYQGQYDIVEGYDLIDTNKVEDSNALEYFEKLGKEILESKSCIDEKDTHLHSLIDDIVCLIYKTLYKLKYLK